MPRFIPLYKINNLLISRHSNLFLITKLKKYKFYQKYLNMYPGNYNFFQKILLTFFIFFINPIKYLSKPGYYLRILLTHLFR
jgi:hypothetical protein